MHDMDDNMRKEVLGEALMDELKIIREYLEDIPTIKRRVESIDRRLHSVERDIKAIKVTIIEHDQTLNNHDIRLNHLEANY